MLSNWDPKELPKLNPENEELGHASEMGPDRLEGLWRLRHNTA